MFTFLKRCAVVGLAVLALAPSARAAEGHEHLFLGNPSGAAHNREKPDNYLMTRRQYALSYNSSKGTPNWVSWQLSKRWLGKTTDGLNTRRSCGPELVLSCLEV
jgi:DNA/RNA endonuclease G (NUC1)